MSVKLLALNDLHGHLLPPPGGFRAADPAQPDRVLTHAAGGVEHLATAVRALRAGARHSLVVAAGDLVGASPLLSALFHDEPTIESLGLMGLDFSAVGNHEFDEGVAELLRLQTGGCHPTDGCGGRPPFTGARFQYLAASTVDRATRRPVLPAYGIRRFGPVALGVVGLTLRGTPRMVAPRGVERVTFLDEVATINAVVPELLQQGVRTVVVLLHEGGEAGGDANGCDQLRGPIVDIVPRLHPAVRVVVSGHTHQAYVCRLAGRLVTSAHRHGTLLTEIDLVLDARTGETRSADAHNHIVRHDLHAKDPTQSALIARYAALAAPLAQRAVGSLDRAYTAAPNEAGESDLGRLVADAQLAATAGMGRGGAQVAFTNPGGLRAALQPGPGGVVRYEDVFAAQPFGNALVTLTLTGKQVRELLEAQFGAQVGERPRLLQASRGFHWAYDPARPRGQRVLPNSLTLDGRPVRPHDTVRVTVNSYLAEGGDGHRLFAEGRDRTVGVGDADALAMYLASVPSRRPFGDRAPRVTRRGR